MPFYYNHSSSFQVKSVEHSISFSGLACVKTYLSSKRVWFTSGLILLIAFLFVIFVDLEEVINLLGRTDWRYLVTGCLSLLAGYLFFAIRWRDLLSRRPSYSRVFHVTNFSLMVNIYSPIPAVPVRTFLIGDGKQITVSQAASSSVIERLLEQIMRLTALGGGLLLGTGLVGAISTLASGLGMIIVALVLITWALSDIGSRQIRLAGWLVRLPMFDQAQAERIAWGLMNGLRDAGTPGQLFMGWLWSLLIWACFLFFHLFGLLALGISLPLGVLLGICLGALAVAPPSAPAMPGTYHASIVVGLAVLTHIDGVTLTAYAILLHLAQLVCLTGLGLWALVHLNLNLREILRDETSPQRLSEYD
jgi:uncharacterized protein (TIRG00374 family)